MQTCNKESTTQERANGEEPLFSVGQLKQANQLVLRYHYSHRIPSNIQQVLTWHEPGGLFGASGEAIAAVYFTIPSARWSEDVWELSRLVRVDESTIQLSRLIAKAIRFLKANRLIDLVVSFADATQGHHGGIYQACSWNYGGMRPPRMDGLLINGVFETGRACNHRYGTRSASRLKRLKPGWHVEEHWDKGKYLYWKAIWKSGFKKADRLGLELLSYPKPTKPVLPFLEQAPAEALQLDAFGLSEKPPT